MAVTHSTTIRNQLCNLVVDALDSGSTYTYPRLVFRDGSNNDLCINNFTGTTAFAAASNGTALANNIADGTVTQAGTCSKFVLQDQDGTTVVTGSVTTQGGGGDIELSSVAFSVSDTVNISTLSYAAAS